MAETIIVTPKGQERRAFTAEEERQRQKDAEVIAADKRAMADAEAQRRADEQAWRDAIANATSLDDIKAVLLGTNLPAQAEARVKG